MYSSCTCRTKSNYCSFFFNKELKNNLSVLHACLENMKLDLTPYTVLSAVCWLTHFTVWLSSSKQLSSIKQISAHKYLIITSTWVLSLLYRRFQNDETFRTECTTSPFFIKFWNRIFAAVYVQIILSFVNNSTSFCFTLYHQSVFFSMLWFASTVFLAPNMYHFQNKTIQENILHSI